MCPISVMPAGSNLFFYLSRSLYLVLILNCLWKYHSFYKLKLGNDYFFQNIIQMVLDLWLFDLWFFGSVMLQKWYAFSTNCTLNCGLFLGQCYVVGYSLWCWAVAKSRSSQPAMRSWGSTTHTFCSHTTILLYTFSTVFNKLRAKSYFIVK